MKASGNWGNCHWELYNWGLLTFEGGLATSIEKPEDVPWKDYLDKIETVGFEDFVSFPPGASLCHLFDGCAHLKQVNFEYFNTAGVVDMTSMFEGCERLTKVDLAMLDTSKVVSMRAMFMRCESLEKVNVEGLDTSNVRDMGWMFCNCENLKFFDLISLNTSKVENMSHMFQYCSSLRDINVEDIDMRSLRDAKEMFEGCDHINTVPLPVAEEKEDEEDTEKKKKKEGGRGFLGGRLRRNHPEVAEPKEEAPEEAPGYTAGNTAGYTPEYTQSQATERPIGETVSAMIPDEFANEFPSEFPEELSKESSNEVERKAKVGANNINAVQVKKEGSDHTMYLGAPMFLGEIEQLPPITYGERFSFRAPQLDRSSVENGVQLYVELSPDGENQWTPIDPAMILPVKASGCYVRYLAKNEAGFDVTESVPIIIRKADYDMSEVRWKTPDNPIYDGSVKSVKIVGLPEGLQPIYKGKEAVDAGEYLASASWDYDEDNYNCPPAMPDCIWRIRKGDFDASGIDWAYDRSFVYDGGEHEVVLTGVPEGVSVRYTDNLAVEVGKYHATAELIFNKDNFRKLEREFSISWEITKADPDMSMVRWPEEHSFVYDGSYHELYLENVPSYLRVRYTDNIESQSGRYTARAIFEPYDRRNYKTPEPVSLQWEISKAKVDLSILRWNVPDPIIYDGSVKTVNLIGVPNMLSVQYIGEQEIDAGEYEAIAKFTLLDENNYEPVSDMSCFWTIQKADYDLSNVEWTYVSPYTYDGEVKMIELVNLPSSITPEYIDNEAINAGTYTAQANLRYDTKNYNKPSFKSCDWEIRKANCDVSQAYWVVPTNLEYDGREKEVYLAGLPDNFSIDYTDNAKTDVGEYCAEARVSAKDATNYNDPHIKGVQWRITQAKSDVSGVEWNYKEALVHDGSLKRVEILNVPSYLEVEYTDNESADAGEHFAIAMFHSKDGNHETPAPMSLEWTILKGDYDMRAVRWSYTDALPYNGKNQQIELVNLPDGVIATYTGNIAKDVGKYAARVKLAVTDPDNYNIPFFSGINWEICKATFDLSETRWTYNKAFSYDGELKKVEIEGLPEGLVAKYTGNTGTSAAEYCASASFEYDEKNYNKPEFPILWWKISKGEYNVSNVRWNYVGPFTYDGNIKTVELVGLKGDVSVRYAMNKAIDAGVYEAEAYLFVKDGENYEQPHKMTISWEIKKASFDMSNVMWSYDEPITYNGLANVITLYNLPDGVWAEYDNNIEVNAGKYEASARFGVNNSDNYIVPEMMTCQWEIKKRRFDMSMVHWDFRKIQAYNGKEQTVELLGLPSGLSATCTGNTAVNAGVYDASCELSPIDDWNYVKPSVDGVRWEIEKADYDMSAVRWNYNSAFTYDGTEHRVELVGLPDGVKAEYTDNFASDAGLYKASVKFIIDDEANYNMPTFESCMWRIRKADYDMSDARWSYEKGQFIYDGHVKSVKLEGLPNGVSASYSGNAQVRAGEYVAMARFDIENPNNFNVPTIPNCYWKIEKNSYDLSGVSWSEESFVYDGREKRVRLMGLPAGVTATYTGNTETRAGKYVAVPTLHVDVDNYEIPQVDALRWEIKKADINISGATWDYSSSFAYDGRSKTVSIVGLPQGVGVSYTDNSAINAGEYTATARLIIGDESNYNVPVMEPCTWKIDQIHFDMSKVKWTTSGSYVYDGSEKSVVLKGLPEGINVRYEENSAVNAGDYTARAILSFDRNNYFEPTVPDYEWSIKKADFDMTPVSWDYISEFTYDGKDKTVELIGLPDGVKAVYEDNCKMTAGEYEASVSFVYDEINYNEPSFKSCKWRISKADLDLSQLEWNYRSAFVYDGEEHRVEFKTPERKGFFFGRKKSDSNEYIGLPEGVNVEFSDNSFEDAGKYIAKAYFTPVDTDNYNTPEPLACKWEIRKAEPDMSRVKWNCSRAFTYDGEEKEVAVVGLPEAVSVKSYTGNKAIAVGVYTARVEFKVDPDGNFTEPEGMTFGWKIEKKLLDTSGVHWTYHDGFTYDGTTKTVELENLPPEVSVSYLNNSAVEPGTYVAKALPIYDQASYQLAELPDCKWKIVEEVVDTSKE